MSNTDERLQVTFAAIDPYIDTRVVSPKESKSGKYVSWGTANRYPHYLVELFNSVPTLRSIVLGSADFVAGNDVTSPIDLNTRRDTPRDIVAELGLYDFLFGGFALQVIRDRDGQPREVYPVNPAYLRADEDCEVFYYSEKWDKGARNVIVYPKYIDIAPERWASLSDEERNRHASSILYVKTTKMQTYPAPLYAAAVKACEMERGIDDYHINALENSFTSSLVVNFNNGVPTDAVKEEIEREFTEKFTGSGNAGRIMFSWNKTRDTATTMQSVKVEDFGERYEALAKHSRQQIFTAFGASPVIFGIPTDNNGFSTDDYEAAFKLYNRTRIVPCQRRITDAMERVFGPGVLTIQPFNLDTANTQIQ